jgi:serine/threonine protein kinase
MIEKGKVLQQRYRIDRQIGQGGMGAVYIATDERFGSTVAIKETLCMDDNYRKAIEREARLLNNLKHSALPRVTDHFLEEDGQFLVMEYISGEDLCRSLEDNSRPFPVAQVLKWADQLLDALDFLHNQVNPVIHRDIKPQNLKVAPNGQIILLDFGLAKGNPTDAGHQTAAKSIFGYSRNYASLEQIQGTGTDPRSDLYSLAATLYHLLTNAAPEDALTRAMAVLSHLPDPLIPANRIVADVPPGVAGVLQNALALNAGQRPATAAEMRTMLREHEKYADLVAGSFANAPAQTGILSQPTKIMPGSTVHHGERPTDVKTEILPRPLSHVTALKASASDTASRPKRRFSAVAVGIIGLLLVGSVVSGAYLYDPALFTGGSGAETAAPNAVEAPAVAESNGNTVANTVPGEEPTSVAESSSAPTAVAKTSDPVKNSRGRTAPSRTVDDDEPDDVNIDDETVQVGNSRTGPGRVQSQDRIMDQHVTPQNPMVPRVDPVVIPPIDMRYMTPRQRRRLQETLRRNRVRMAPNPTPPN